ncbi:MAG: hypothetical protein KAX93_00270 [Flavobacterium sp.]|nr:hypothetical protein [Flavobacterium sp.]
MTFREPTFQELFPISHIQELTKLQSTHFVNQTLAKGGITEGLKEMPVNLPDLKPYNQVILERSVASNLTTNYIKINWRVIIASALLGGIVIYVAMQIHQQNKKNKTKNLLN